MTFAQRRNRLTTHFSESIPVVKRRISVYVKTYTRLPTKIIPYWLTYSMEHSPSWEANRFCS